MSATRRSQTVPHSISTAEYAALRAETMPEADLEEAIRKRCKALHLRYYHTHRSDRSASGFPDDVIVGPGGMLIRENKSTRGKVSKEQWGWLSSLAAIGIDTGVWRPEDLLSGRIDRELGDIR